MSAYNFVLITMIILLACNIIGLLLSLLPIYFKGLLKYRIQDKKINSKEFFKRLPLIGFNIAILAIVSSIGLYYIFPVFFDASLEFNGLVVLLQLLFVLFMDDLFFYFLHRWMHENKTLLKAVHSIHHRATAPLALEYLYVHPFEWMMGYVGPFIGLLVIGSFFDLSCWTFWIYMLIRNLHELDIHSGFKSLFSHWIPFWGESEHHDQHHEKLNGNYASTFTIWDRVFDTKMKD